jgi:hypothetical protein
MPFKDITAAIGASKDSDIQAVHYLEEQESALNSVIADPHAFLKKSNLAVSDQSQVQTTVKHRASRAAARLRRIIIIIVIHYRNCDTDIIIFL